MDGMESLFDQDKPHFKAWIGLYDIDTESDAGLSSEIPSPLYYSALCGFHDLVQHLATKHPEHVKAFGGSYGFPLIAALCRNHFWVAELLLELGGKVDVRAQDDGGQTALHKIIGRRHKMAIDAVQFLLKRGADVNARRNDLSTPLHLSANVGRLAVARMLLDHRADVNSRNDGGQTPLHLLSSREAFQDEGDDSDLAKLLLERGANVNEKDKDNESPLHSASYNKKFEIVRVLLNHGADANAKNDRGETPFEVFLSVKHNAPDDGLGLAKLFREHGAEGHLDRIVSCLLPNINFYIDVPS